MAGILSHARHPAEIRRAERGVPDRLKTVVVTKTVDDAELEELLHPRTDPVIERAMGDGIFELEDGPFEHYRRIVVIDPHRTAEGLHAVTETTTFELAIPIWGWMFKGLVVRAIKHPPKPGTHVWWLPPDRMDKRSTEVLALLCVFSLIAGYLGVLLSQLNPYFIQEFTHTTNQSPNHYFSIAQVALPTRFSGIFALVVVAFADRKGRKRVLMIAAYGAITFAVLGALAPNLAWMSSTQTVARTFSASIALLIGIISAEEMPKGARAFAVSVLVATAALGAGGVVVFLQVADLGVSAWRIFFLVPVVMLYPTYRLSRRLPESRRYEVFDIAGGRATEVAREIEMAPDEPTSQRMWFRFAILGASAFLVNIFATPAGLFFNQYFKTEQGYNGLKITGLQILTNLPGGISMVVGGRLAESHGRRLIGAIGVGGGVGFTVLMFLVNGWPLWLFSTAATLLGAMSVPALGVYSAELFPTGSRGRAGGGLNLFGVVGGALGLVIMGYLADQWGLGPAAAVLGVPAAVAVVVIILALYPETAQKELEELNPEDSTPPLGRAELAELDEEFDELHHLHDHTEGTESPVQPPATGETGEPATTEPITRAPSDPESKSATEA